MKWILLIGFARNYSTKNSGRIQRIYLLLLIA
jgi:hypothetical protein